jgi:hypothetical protein
MQAQYIYSDNVVFLVVDCRSGKGINGEIVEKAVESIQ